MLANQNRRTALAALACAVMSPWAAAQSQRKSKELIASVPVFSWLRIGETTLTNARITIQRMLSQAPRQWFREGASEITGGTYMTLSDLNGQGMLGEDGMRALTLVFDPAQKAQLAIFLIERGWNDVRVQPLINRITARYASMADPVRVEDGESEAADYYIIFDLGRFIIEISIPQHGTLLSVYFTTKEIHQRLRTADGTFHIFKPYLDQMR